MDDTLEIKIPDIEKEFARLRKNAEESKQMIACLFTLVIFAHEPKRSASLKDLIDNIIAKFPCRLIFIEADLDSNKKYFDVQVSTVMSGYVQSKSTIACDQILIRTSKDQLFRVPYLIIPHLEPDLPVFLLWGQNPFEENEIFPMLRSYASRVIFDSECSDNLNLFCKEMLTGADSLGIDIMDINWALISNWRDMLQQLFSGPEMIKQLRECQSLVITYNDKQENGSADGKLGRLRYPEIRAIYLQGWLASCLGWQFRAIETDQSSTILTYFGQCSPVIVTISPQSNPKLPLGAITSIQLMTKDGTSFDIQRKEHLSQVLIHTSNKRECLLPYTLPLPSAHRGMNFMKEIFYNPSGESYQNMLSAISHIDFDLIQPQS